MNKDLKKNKYYKNAYNNPNQYNFNDIISRLEASENQKTVSMLLNISIAITDATRDKKENNYKFIN